MYGDETLVGGRMTVGIVRRGGHVHRPMGSWSPAVHEFLGHLESVGFAGSPRLVGVEDGREVLTYLSGDVAVDPQWQPGRGARLPAYARTDRALTEAAKLIRRLHHAAAGFRPTLTGYRFHPCAPRPGQIVSHGDLGPWNTVYRAGIPVAFIDWDAAQPVDPLDDLAAAAWSFVPLCPPGQLREAGFDPLPDLPRRLRQFADAYGLADRQALLPALQRAKLHEVERVKYAPLEPAEAAASLEYYAGQLRWLHDVSADLESRL
ncbi:phosphotransferase [Catellatospora sp. NPDC049133]|uniref:phosphotransferase n=1 Tax=Catellatospora sp. NPDC049133 TaxID=3155499 RepID=UPI0033EFC678